AALVLHTPVGAPFFAWVKSGFDALTASSNAGAEFVFGNLTKFFLIQNVVAPGADGQLAPVESYPISAVLAFNVLPVIIFVSALAALLQHLGVVQAIVRGMAWL